METGRKCMECGDLLHGRSDQKFCNDQCRNAHNNKQAVETNNHIRSLNRILKKNYVVLCNFNPSGKSTVTREDLVKKDFNFHYFTSMAKTWKGRVVHFCYDQGYSLGPGEKVLLFRKKPPGGKKNHQV